MKNISMGGLASVSLRPFWPSREEQLCAEGYNFFSFFLVLDDEGPGFRVHLLYKVFDFLMLQVDSVPWNVDRGSLHL